MRNKAGQIRGEKNGGRLGCEASENQKLRLRIFAHPRKIGIRRPWTNDHSTILDIADNKFLLLTLH